MPFVVVQESPDDSLQRRGDGHFSIFTSTDWAGPFRPVARLSTDAKLAEAVQYVEYLNKGEEGYE